VGALKARHAARGPHDRDPEENARQPGRPSRASRKAALALAVRTYRRGERLDLQALAAELRISRASLYRWFGSREDLIGEVLSHEYELALAAAKARGAGSGAYRIADVLHHLQTMIANSRPLATLLAQEPRIALSVLTSSGSPFQQGVVASIADLIRDTGARDGYEPLIDVETLAYALVRLAEAFIYNDAVAGIRGEIEQLHAVDRLLLRAEI
jgi:AcrR family transcriptional regulator